MPTEDSDLVDIRNEIIGLIEAVSVRITSRANTEGREWFNRFTLYPSEFQIYDHILTLSKSGAHLSPVPMGEPPGSSGVGYRILDPVFDDLYIKVKIEEERLWVISFHRTSH